MAYSAALKAHLLSGQPLTYRTKVEIKNESDAWIDFSDRDPLIGTIRISGDRNGNRIISSSASVSFTNDDNYFDYMDDPGKMITLSFFGTLASEFLNGFKDKLVRLSLAILLPDGSTESASLGIWRVTDFSHDKIKTRVIMSLGTDIDFLKRVGTQSMSEGLMQYNNRPITYLVREILKKVYPAGVSDSVFEIPDRIYIPTNDGEPALSHYGKPPERDNTGRWRDDVTHKPGAIYYHSDDSCFYFGIGDEVWQFEPDEEIWKLCGNFNNDDLYIRGIYRMTSTRLLVVGWEHDQTARSVTMKTAQVLTTTPTLTTNDPGNDSGIFPGDFVLRDVYHTGGSGVSESLMGYIKNAPDIGQNIFYGLNMPVPFPCYSFSARANIDPDDNHLGITDGIRSEIVGGSWETFAYGVTEPCGVVTLEPCYLGMAGESMSTTEKTTVLIPWGMKPNITEAISPVNWNGPVLFVAETDGNPMGIRLTGIVRILAYNTYAGGHVVVSESDQSGANAPIYGLQYYNQGSDDFLFWIEVNWVEEMVNIGTGGSPGDVDSPIFKVQGSFITNDGSGNPELLDASKFTEWTSGDDYFAGDDSELAPISLFPFGSSAEGFLVVMMDLADMGGSCFELFFVPSNWTTAPTSLGTSRFGWSAFTDDTTNEKVYFISRDTGAIAFVDYSSTPSTVEYISDGEEPVPTSTFEMPQGAGLVLTTESSKRCIYGVLYPYLPGWTNEGGIWLKGKYYFWKYHPKLTDRVELFDEGKRTAWEALGLLAEVADYEVGLDQESVGFFRPQPQIGDGIAFTIDLDSEIQSFLSVKKRAGLSNIVNRIEFIPYNIDIMPPRASLDMKGYIDSDGDQVYFNGTTEVRSESIIEINVTLHCITEGDPGTAVFKYLVHETQVQSALREDTNISGAPRQIRLDSNADIEIGMLVQIGELEESGGVSYKIDSIQSDGDVILNQDLTEDFEKGIVVIFRSPESGTWSTEYDTPDTYTAATTYSEIGSTGLFLKFTADSSPQRFVVGDRIRVYNPGQQLTRSRTRKIVIEDSTSIEKHGLQEFPLDNELMSFGIGRERAKDDVDLRAFPRHYWIVKKGLTLQATVNKIVLIKSKKRLPVATDNEEHCIIKNVTHNLRKAWTEIELVGLLKY